MSSGCNVERAFSLSVALSLPLPAPLSSSSRDPLVVVYSRVEFCVRAAAPSAQSMYASRVRKLVRSSLSLALSLSLGFSSIAPLIITARTRITAVMRP